MNFIVVTGHWSELSLPILLFLVETMDTDVQIFFLQKLLLYLETFIAFIRSDVE